MPNDIRQAYLIVYGVKGRDRKSKRHFERVGTYWPDTPNIPAECVAKAKEILTQFKTYDPIRSTLHWDAGKLDGPITSFMLFDKANVKVQVGGL